MKKLLKGLTLIWISFTPVIASAHSGHGLMGEEHYHAPINLEILLALVVVGIVAIGLKHFIKSKK
ncbi:MAG: hypothetical protein OQK25_05415 [Gammaproteobacteria bacterium]|nr:hypothetical protein [Gammaproteobacteria bacterium]